MSFTPLSYRPEQPSDFFKTLKNRIDSYFVDNKKDRQGDFRMYFKTFFMLVAYITPYYFIISGSITNPFIYTGLWVLMGVFMAGIGLSIMHDAIHGSYSKNSFVNKLIGEVINLVGGAAINWKIQHNVLHHTYTNVEEYDMDINGPAILRFSPNQKKIGIHKYQHIYAWFLYGLLTLNWATYKDFNSLIRYKKMGLIGGGKYQFTLELIKIIIMKLLYFTFMIVFPIYVGGATGLTVVLNFVVMQWIAGFILSCVFQPAHVMEECEFAVASDDKIIHEDWAAHQVINTVNFAPKNKLLGWYIGGLNFQVEHHLFPNICHIHYRALSQIVKATAEEFKLPYNVQPTFGSALWSHMKMLKELGKAEE